MLLSILKKRPVVLYSGLLFLLTWLLYANTLSNKFAFDDKSLVVENRLVNESFTISEVFSTNYRYGAGFTTDGLYRPLVILSFIMNKTGASLNPFPFHLVNITINAINTVLLFLLFRALTGNIPLSALSSLLFAFHPIHTEAVANIAGRPELLCLLFMLLSWMSTEYFTKKPFAWCFSGVFLMAALLSKETAVMLPFMILTADMALGRPVVHWSASGKYISMVVIIILYSVIRLNVLPSLSLGFTPDFVDNPIAASPFAERIATAFSVFVRYLVLLFFPLRLSSDYSYNQIPIEHSLTGILPLLGIVIMLSLVATALYSKRTHTTYLLGLAFFFFPYILISNIVVPIGTIMGERLMYVPSAGYSLVLGAAIVTLYHRWRQPSIVLTSILLLLFGARTVTRNTTWSDDTTLFSADMKNAPHSVKILCNMGFLVSGEDGEQYYRKALEIYPRSESALTGLARNLYGRRLYEESMQYYAAVVHLYPDNASGHFNLGTVLDKLERYGDAEKELLTAIRLDPGAVKPYEAIGAVYINLMQYAKAISYLEKALSMGGNKNTLYNNLAAAYFLSGDMVMALKYVSAAEKLGLPLNPEMVRTIKSATDSR